MTTIIVRKAPGKHPSFGLLTVSGKSWPCVLGKNGITTKKQEGDGATPAGRYELLTGYWRKDRFHLPQGRRKQIIGFAATSANRGWCDDPGHPAYNSEVPLPFPASHEKLRRDDRLYDCCIVLDHNIHPQIRNRGSAIFFHLTSPDRKPTLGCVAVEPDHMRQILTRISGTGKTATMEIRP